MFKYIKYKKVETVYTVLEFRGGDESTKVNHFDVDVVSVEAAIESDIDELIAQQPVEIECTVINKSKFKILVSDTAQLKRIREVVSIEIGKRYTISDEIGIGKRAVDDGKRIAYNAYVESCISKGVEIKALIGY